METITIDGKKHNIYATTDIARIKNCSIRTVELWATKLYGPYTKGKKRIFTEEQKEEILKKIQPGPGRPKGNN